MGCIFRKKWKDKKTGEVTQGETLWIKYYRYGKPYFESSHSTREAAAKKLLKLREGEISKGEIPGIHFDKISFDDLAEDFLTEYTINQRKSLRDAKRHAANLKRWLGGMRVTEITTASVKEYTKRRMNDGLSNATINRELSALKRMFSLAAECTPPKIGQVPYVPMLKESNTRKGFFEHEKYLAIRDALPSYLKAVITFAYHTGWRFGEILGLTWDKMDLKLGIIRLDPGETKNKEARTFHLFGELLEQMKILHSNRRLGCPYIFHRDGKQIKSFRKAWATACVKAGLCKALKDEKGNLVMTKGKKGEEKTAMVPTKLFHDFRRTGVRNMVRAGVPERVAMMVSGHKTRSVFERYNIVSDQDLKDAARKMEVYLNSQSAPEMVTATVTVSQKVVNLEGRTGG